MLQEIKKRLEDATPGPWFTAQPCSTVYIEARLRGSILQEVAACGPTETPAQQGANADLIANAPTNIAFLIAEVERLRGILQNDITSACDDCIDLGASGKATAETIKIIIAAICPK